MAHQQWWERPRLRTDEEEHRERRVSWLELFFDLVFVVVVAELAHNLADDISWTGVGAYMLLFIPAWWAWIGGTFYNDRFETEDVSYRLFTFLTIIPIAAMAVFAHYGLSKTSVHFALSYAAVRALIIAMWVRGGWHVPNMRPMTNRYAIGFGLSFILFVASVFVPPPWRFVMWGIGLCFDLLTPIATLSIQARLPRVSSSKLAERFGLFIIIVLGEAMVGTIAGVAEQESSLSPATGLIGVIALALVFCLWWVYFDFIARRPARPNVWVRFTWTYLHLPLAMAIAALGAGMLNVLTHEDGELGMSARWLVAGSVAVALFAMGLLELTLRRAPDEPTIHRVSVPLKVAAGVAALALGALGGALSPAALLVLLLLLLMVQMGYGVYVWYQPRPVMVAAEAAGAE